jgi:hypothetical protein
MRSRKYVFLMTGFLVCIILSAALYWIIPGREENLKATLHVPPEAILIAQDQGTQGGDIIQKSIYYWIPLSIQEVQTYYEASFPKFLPGNVDKEWLITAFDNNKSLPLINNAKSAFLSHHSFCERQQPYGCVSIVLINTEQQDITQLPVISPRMLGGQPILPELRDIPEKGTLIIYSYFI